MGSVRSGRVLFRPNPVGGPSLSRRWEDQWNEVSIRLRTGEDGAVRTGLTDYVRRSGPSPVGVSRESYLPGVSNRPTPPTVSGFRGPDPYFLTPVVMDTSPSSTVLWT